MKKTFLTFLLSIISILGFSQLATIGTEWYYGIQYEMPPGVESYYKYRCEKDTIIDSETYSVIQSYGRANERICMRKDSSKVYYFLDGKKNLLFDFSAKKGDTLELDVMLFAPNNSYQIVKTKALVNNISYLKNYAINATDSIRSFGVLLSMNDNLPNFVICEKLLNIYADYSFISSSQKPKYDSYNFRCYISDGYTFHSSARFNSERTCDYQNVLVNEIKAIESIKVYPNPANSSLFIENKNQSKLNGISIYNALGEQVFQQKLSDSQRLYQLDINEIPSGIYFIQLNDEDSTKTLKLVKQ
jgi:hypothetical protein